MKQGRKIKEWLEELPQPQRFEAINNCINENGAEHLEIKVDSLNRAIYNAFRWDETDEGFDYWCRLLQ